MGHSDGGGKTRNGFCAFLMRLGWSKQVYLVFQAMQRTGLVQNPIKNELQWVENGLLTVPGY